MRFQLMRGLIVILLHGGVLARAVHAFHLAIGPGGVGFGEPMLEATLLADARKDVLKGLDSALAIRALKAVLGEHGVALVGGGGHQGAEELGGAHLVGCFVPRGIGKFARTVKGDQQGERPFFRADLRAVDREVAQGGGLALVLRRWITFHIRQTVDAVPRPAAREGGSRQRRQCRLQGLQAVVER